MDRSFCVFEYLTLPVELHREIYWQVFHEWEETHHASGLVVTSLQPLSAALFELQSAQRSYAITLQREVFALDPQELCFVHARE